MLSESDHLWTPKCLRFGWNLNYVPTSFENGIWKQFYIENIKALQHVQYRVIFAFFFNFYINTTRV
jgi:hypothetical protein